MVLESVGWVHDVQNKNEEIIMPLQAIRAAKRYGNPELLFSKSLCSRLAVIHTSFVNDQETGIQLFFFTHFFDLAGQISRGKRLYFIIIGPKLKPKGSVELLVFCR